MFHLVFIQTEKKFSRYCQLLYNVNVTLNHTYNGIITRTIFILIERRHCEEQNILKYFRYFK